MRYLLALALLLSCGGPLDSAHPAQRNSTLALTGRMVLWGGADADLSRHCVCVGEIDFDAGRWYCGRGHYDTEGAASYHGTVVRTGTGFELHEVHPENGGFVETCEPVQVPAPSASVLTVTSAYRCGYWALTLPWVAVP